MGNYFMNLEWDDKTPLKTKVKAVYNVLNFVSKEMSIGRVPNNKKELENNLKSTKEQLITPLSVAFVKMVEKGEIDEVTASENANMFLEWNEKSSFNYNDYRCREGRLYKCLQAHTGQVGWEPENAPALWKLIGIDENGRPEWSQPISSADAYMLNDEVMHNGCIWVSDYDNNVWEPGIFGWHIKEENTDNEEETEKNESSSGDEVAE